MEQKRESIFRATIRNFFVGFAIVTGMFTSILALIFILALAEQETETYTAEMKSTILPDAKGQIAELAKTTPVILQIDIKGVIGLDNLTMENVRRQLIESHYGDLKGRVKGILLSIESPGGTVTDSDAIYRELLGYKQEFHVPVYAHVDGMCCSGGYLIAAAADKIYATDASIIGSVGVLISTFLNFSKPLAQYGVDTLTITAGKGKDEMNPLRPWAPGESNGFQHIVDYYYQDFLNTVTLHRPLLDKEKLINVYGANVFPAKESENFGYIDASGKSRADTLIALTHEAGLEDKSYQVVRLSTDKWFGDMFKSQLNLLHGKVEHHLIVPGAFDPRLDGKLLFLYRP